MNNYTKLSASRIKTLQSCSWIYHCNYKLKLPDKSNTGAMRGTIAHLILEVLSNSRRAKHVKKIIKDKTCLKSPSVLRLIKKSSQKEGINLDSNAELIKKEDIPISNLDCINQMIMVGLKSDFMKSYKIIGAEIEFDISNESPKYRIGGFIDRVFEDDGKIIIRDYKSSKKPFSNQELKDNVQAMMYALAVKKKYQKYKDVLVKFLFLRHPDNPERACPAFTDEELNGFEHYLEYLNNYIEKFDDTSAKSNMAAYDFKKKWMCQTKSGWKCPYLNPMEYKVLLDKENNIIKSTFIDQDFKASDIKKGYKIEIKKYSGCPAWSGKESSDFF